MHPLNWLLLFFLACLWAVSFPAFSVALTELSPISTVFWRLFPAGIAMMVLALIMGHRFPLRFKFWFPFIILGIFFNLAPFLLIATGQKYIEAGLASILNATTPIFTGALAHFVFASERLNLLKVFGLLLGLFGISILFGIDALTNFDPRNFGQLLILLAGCCYAFSGVFAKKFVMNYSVIKTTAAMLFCSGMLSFFVSLFIAGPPQLARTAEVWGALMFMSFGGTAAAYVLYYLLMRKMGATGVSLVTFIVPPIAIFVSWVLLRETLGLNAYAGMAVIFLSLVCMDARVQKFYSRLREGAGVRSAS